VRSSSRSSARGEAHRSTSRRPCHPPARSGRRGGRGRRAGSDRDAWSGSCSSAAVPENVGAAARVLGGRTSATPTGAVSPERLDQGVARRMAIGAGGPAHECDGCHARRGRLRLRLGAGHRSRRVRGRPPMDPERWPLPSRRSPRGPTALVFGGERDGLRAGELARCDALSRIPRGPAALPQPGPGGGRLRLRAPSVARPPQAAAPAGGERPAAADDAEMLRVESALRDALAAAASCGARSGTPSGDLSAPCGGHA